MRHDEVEDDIEELRAARIRMMRPDAVWLHKIAHVLDSEPAPAVTPAKTNLGFMMTNAAEDERADAALEEALRRAHERSTQPMSTPESIARGAAFIKQARIDAAAVLQDLIARGDLLAVEAFQRATGMSSDALNESERVGRLFSIPGPDGTAFYPAFYAAPHNAREQIERVTQQLADLPPTVKYHFFVSRAFSLSGVTPLEALQAGRLDDVLRAATEYVLR